MTYKGSSREVDLALLKKEIDDRILKFLDALSALVARDKLIWEDPRRSMEKVFAETLNILKEAFGSFGDAYECKFCNRTLPSPNYYYRGVGQYDIQHAIIAREMKASKLITFDRGFDVLSKHNFFPTIIFDIR